jgi:hypothetical protein
MNKLTITKADKGKTLVILNTRRIQTELITTQPNTVKNHKTDTETM